MDRDSPAVQSFVSVGSARLPKTVSGDGPGVLMIELILDSEAGRIVEVAATIPLPGYAALLRSLLVGQRMDEVEAVARRLSGQFRGPLLRPTIAALASAVSNGTGHAETEGEALAAQGR